MKWIKDNYRTILLWLVLLVIAPLFVELLFVANIVGAEVALSFLLLVIKDIFDTWKYRTQRLKAFLMDIFRIIQHHPMFQINTYLFHVAASVLILFVSGSIAYSVLMWYPIVLANNTIS